MKQKTTLSNILIQIVPVMIGVYLGFALNNFGENRKLKNEAATFSKMLKNEIEQNLKEIKRVQDYHKKLGNDMQEMMKSKDLVKSFNEYKMQGLRPGFVNDSAYKTGLQTGIIQQFDLELIQRLNALYKLQENYDNFNETMLSTFLANGFPETETKIRNTLIVMSMNMNDVNNFEKNLVAFYTQILEDI